MRLHINLSKHGGKTGRILAEAAGAIAIDSDIERSKLGENDILINWGGQLSLVDEERIGLVVNRSLAVRAAGSKSQALSIMSDAGIDVPQFVNEPPCIARAESHFGGRGFWLCFSKDAMGWAQNWGASHFLEILPVAREYRVHAWLYGDAQSIVREKIANGVKNKPLAYTIRNLKNGWSFRVPASGLAEEVEKVRAAGVAAVSALGLDFGAADVAVCEDGRVCVLEVNCAPGLNPALSSFAFYVEAISSLVSK